MAINVDFIYISNFSFYYLIDSKLWMYYNCVKNFLYICITCIFEKVL